MVDGELDLEREAAQVRGGGAEQAEKGAGEGAEAAGEQGFVGIALGGDAPGLEPGLGAAEEREGTVPAPPGFQPALE